MRYCQEGELYRKLQAKSFPCDVHFELTYRCNLRCCHCYCQGLPSDKKELSLREIKKILDGLHREGSLWLSFSGGEPLIRKDFLDIYSYAKAKGFIVSIFTNALLFNRKILRYLRQAPPYSIEVTVNGMTRATYESITGVQGTFAVMKRNLALLKECRLPVIIKTNLMQQNKREFVAIKNWAKKLLATQPDTYPFKYDYMIYPRFNGDKEPLQYRLDFNDLQKILKEDHLIRQQYQQELHRAFPHNLRDQSSLYPCAVGMDKAFISPYGRLKFCLFSKRYSVDLRRTPLLAGFRKMVSSLAAARFTTASKCRTCRLRMICYWCPARARLEMGSQEAPVAYFCRLAENIGAMTKRLRKNAGLSR